MTFRFVHTADIHLDSPLRSLAMRDADLAEQILTASRVSLTGIVDLCIEENVDALLIAGDLYDGSQTSMATARFLTSQLERLCESGIRTFIIRGNHDAESGLTRQMVWPASVHVFTGTPGVETLGERGRTVCIHGISFSEKQVTENLLHRFGSPVTDAINIGMLHTSLGGSEGHDPYSPCSVQQLKDTGFDYWALGHVHKRSMHGGKTTVVMPGIPQGRDIGEDGRKSVTLVTIGDDGKVSTEERFTSVAEFRRMEIRIDGAEDWTALIGMISTHINAARDGSDTPHLVLRIGLTGSSCLKWQMSRDHELLENECRHAAERHAGVWIDKLEDRTTRPTVSDEIEDQAAAMTGLLAVPAHDLVPGEDARRYKDELVKKLPSSCRNLFGTTEEEADGKLRSLTGEGFAEVLAMLQSNEEGAGS